MLQKEYRDAPAFAAWYKNCERGMHDDPLLQFFKKLRNYVVKEGPAPITRIVTLAGVVIAHAELRATATVIRGKPWYRRGISILWDDLTFSVRQWLRLCLRQLQGRIKRWRVEARHDQSPEKIYPDSFVFLDPAWQMKPAVDLLEDYLARLDTLVSEAENQFELGVDSKN
jgi:hypothetical protein